MGGTLHVISGDIAGGNLSKSIVQDEVFVWHDILYDGPRNPGWPDEAALSARALFLEEATGGGLNREFILATLKRQYAKICGASNFDHIVLWFDACLFDQSMLVHILACLGTRGAQKVNLICLDEFPGILPFHGIGQLKPEQFAGLLGREKPVTDEQFRFAEKADEAFASRNPSILADLASLGDAPLPWVPSAAGRLLQELPDPETGLGRLESLVISAIDSVGHTTPGEILASVAAADEPPRFWGDTVLWAKVNGLADRMPPLVEITGPRDRLPQWESPVPLEEFRVRLSGGKDD